MIPNKNRILFDHFSLLLLEGCIHIDVSNPVTTTIFMIIIMFSVSSC